jgi:hypothetical protein
MQRGRPLDMDNTTGVFTGLKCGHQQDFAENKLS